MVLPDVEELTRAFIPREIAHSVKPDPGHLYQALECLAVEPAHALMVGDHPMDVETAKSAGAMSAAVTSGKLGPDAFAHLDPDFMAEDVGALMEQLEVAGLL